MVISESPDVFQYVFYQHWLPRQDLNINRTVENPVLFGGGVGCKVVGVAGLDIWVELVTSGVFGESPPESTVMER